MRVWLILLLLFCGISLSVTYEHRKSVEKRKHMREGDEEDDLPPLPALDDDDASYDEDDEIPLKISKDHAKHRHSKSGRRQEAMESDGASTDDMWEVCDHDKNEACICEANEVLCDKVTFKDEQSLKTTNLALAIEGFETKRATFKDNAISRLLKGKILPGHERELEELDFSNNRIIHIEKETFAMMRNLKKLYLNSNLLGTIKQSMWIGAESLHQLYISDNKIKTIEEGAFSDLVNLKTLTLDGNQLELKKEMFTGLENLEKLSLDNCGLLEIDVDLFEKLPKLMSLSLRNNPFVEVPRAINTIPNLQYLDISGTNIPELHEQSFKEDRKMKQIYMQDMPYLYSIQNCAFCGLQKLEMVHMNNNSKLYELHSNAFGFAKEDTGAVTSLKHLYVEGANLSSISEETLNWNQLDELGIGGNPLTCNCDTAFLLGTVYYSYEYTNSIPRCAAPPELKGKPLAKVAPYEACDTIEAEKKASKAVVVLAILLLCVLVSASVYILWSTGRLRKFYYNVSDGSNAFPAMAYSNLNHPEEQRNLDADFQPRPEEV